jgi:hypothetical protein
METELIIVSIILGWSAGIATFIMGWMLGKWSYEPELDQLRKRNAFLEAKETSTRKKEKGAETVTATPSPLELAAKKKSQTQLLPTEPDK